MNTKNRTEIKRPKKLNKGDTIGIISPAGAVKSENLWKPTTDYFESKGYKVQIAPHSKDKKAYLAGNDADRLSDLTEFFKDESIKAIICSRGGYGTYRLLSRIDYSIINNNPKIFIGYSDITSLLISFIEKSNLVTFHGPLALSDFGVNKIDNYTESNFFEILEGRVTIPYSFNNPANYNCIKQGECEGILMGGNLAVLTGLLGTSYFPDLNGKILFLEDIGEPLYKIDRMLMQLKLAGVFNKISGLLFGEFTSIVQPDNQEINRLTPVDIIEELTNDLDIPVGYGFAASHGTCKATLPLGIRYHFNSKMFNLSLLEDYILT